VIETELRIGDAPRVLEARIARPEGHQAGAVVCHPHPQYGGDMDNAVVTLIASALVDAGRAVLRFNFGGVGASGGSYGGGVAEIDDVRAAVAALATRIPAGEPITLVGYSFGAWVALRAAALEGGIERIIAVAPPLAFFDWEFLADVRPPVSVVVGDRDEYCPRAKLASVMSRHPVQILKGADHFFGGHEDEVAAAVVRACVTG
jgi:hypothetical protein